MREYLLMKELGKLSAIHGLFDTDFIERTEFPGFWVPLSHKDMDGNLLICLLDIGWVIVLLAINFDVMCRESLAF
jgi:hypothetical protein